MPLHVRTVSCDVGELCLRAELPFNSVGTVRSLLKNIALAAEYGTSRYATTRYAVYFMLL